MKNNENRPIYIYHHAQNSSPNGSKNIKPATLNPIEEKVGNTLEHIGAGDHFLNITPAAQTLRETINKWDFLKLKNFCKAKDTVNKTKQILYRIREDLH